MSGSRASSAFTSVDLPAPDGAATMNNLPVSCPPLTGDRLSCDHAIVAIPWGEALPTATRVQPRRGCVQAHGRIRMQNRQTGEIPVELPEMLRRRGALQDFLINQR